MRNRFSQLSKRSIRALCVLAACGLTYSCSDDYFWDDETPAWLGSSIYSTLQERGNFTNVVKLIDKNEDLKKTLQQTGSRTLFVANDEAFDLFYKENALRPVTDPWHTATSVDNLTESQRKIILNSCMINNPYQLEMLSSLPNGTESPTKGKCLRRTTTADVMDSLAFFTPDMLPAKSTVPDAEDLWSDLRTEGAYLLTDNTPTMMLHFINNQMSQNSITDEDFEILTGTTRTSNDVHIYDSKIVEQNITCQNGYINVVDRVILPPSNMAEVIRTNGQTNIFSHILDRFSAPFENVTQTETYRRNHPEFTGKIYEKRYASAKSHTATTSDYTIAQTGSSVDKKPTTGDFEALLDFDPGWNAYATNDDPSTDMAAFFVPNDDAMWKFFQEEGKVLIDVYGEYDNTRENLYKNIDLIPLSTLNALINNLLKSSLINSVPSKFASIKDKAQDNMFTDASHGRDDLVEAKLANNGVVYIMNKVYMPVDYVSVAAPAFISQDRQIIKWAVFNGEQEGDGNTDYMSLKYYAYLRALSSEFTFLIPSDAGMQYYYDPVSVGTQTDKARVIQFTLARNLVSGAPHKYNDDEEGRIATQTTADGTLNVGTGGAESELTNRLQEILESHTIIHTKAVEKGKGLACGNEFFLAKNGAPIRIDPDAIGGDPANIKEIRGGFQLDNQSTYGDLEPSAEGYNTGRTVCKVEEDGYYSQKNGWSYVLNAPVNPTRNSVYSILAANEDMSEFLTLCDGDDDVIERCELIDATLTTAQKEKEYNKYHMFTSLDAYDYTTTIFNNYNYTVYVPTNDAVRAAINDLKLPTWESIKAELDAYYEAHPDAEELDEATRTRVQTQVRCLMNFIKGHFQDQSVFADRLPDSDTYTVATLNEYNTFVTLDVTCNGGPTSEQSSLTIKDASGHYANTVNPHNLLARDPIYRTVGGNTSVTRNGNSIKNILIDATSYAVVHQIDRALQYTTLPGGTYESLWEN